jgi:hypothetical protein
VVALVAPVALVALMAGCGPSYEIDAASDVPAPLESLYATGAPESASASGEADSAGTAAEDSASGDSSAASGSSDSTGKVTSGEVCAALRQVQPELNRAKSAAAARLALGLRLAGVYSAKDALAEMTGPRLDDLTGACPKDTEQAQKATKITTFKAL